MRFQPTMILTSATCLGLFAISLFLKNIKVNKPQGVYMLDHLSSIFPKEKALQCTAELLSSLNDLVDSIDRDECGAEIDLTVTQRNEILDCISQIVLQYKR